MKRAAVAVALLSLTLACKSGGDGGKSGSSSGQGQAANEPASGSGDSEGKQPDEPAKGKPRGWKAYTGKRITDTEGVKAADAEVESHDGKKLQLASTWKDGYAALVFYRGHW